MLVLFVRRVMVASVMRDFLFAFWGVATALSVAAGVAAVVVLLACDAPVLVVASSIAGTVVSGVLGMTVMFVVDNVGRR